MPITLVVGGLFFDVVDDEDGGRAFFFDELDAELTGHGVGQGEAAVGVGGWRVGI